jgi:hypothetical protein
MKARWIGLVSILAVVVALVVYKQAVKAPAAPAATGPLIAAQGPTVLLFADPREAEETCGCGEIFRLVRDAGTHGVLVQEIAPDSDDERIRAHRVVVSPTVIVLDANENEIARHEGEDPATIAAIRAGLDNLLQETQ